MVRVATGEFQNNVNGFFAHVWATVPRRCHVTTAIFYVPHMTHRPHPRFINALMPSLVRYAGAALSPHAKPTAGFEHACCLATSTCPSGEWLQPPTRSMPLDSKLASGPTIARQHEQAQPSGLVTCLRHCGCLPPPKPKISLRDMLHAGPPGE
mmetsp:Transcript_26609/g.44181  ORF Transcript_26609/g.44181 Transcript_26609/m.44181 type:complete len:153 (-) Transcript_26609:160-618(-)|eukprot:CAMPEP_0119335360 /NCGR_PEP_ID=MMETSP1333-20130426/89423_1 /TAXON_ID=418940 /ORGANISM="Scyphosphaera apsteinii, Strain RCC1455" /LENGTH=152 /DNA_ID=CAMNT_0007345893 /DNA_START=254 /DNA_END=712 /DNA_ORIENTATION=-